MHYNQSKLRVSDLEIYKKLNFFFCSSSSWDITTWHPYRRKRIYRLVKREILIPNFSYDWTGLVINPLRVLGYSDNKTRSTQQMLAYISYIISSLIHAEYTC